MSIPIPLPETLVEDNPDLPYSMIRDILISMQEANLGETEPYQFGEGDEV
ncbi:MAG: hypothetical protein ACHQAX_09115 [Gammaproteobacteria bacterium]